MDETEQQGESLNPDLLLLKREVDALQIAIHRQEAPWYKNMSTVLSIVALLFSFGTTFVSYKRTESQDVQNARVELRGKSVGPHRVVAARLRGLIRLPAILGTSSPLDLPRCF